MVSRTFKQKALFSAVTLLTTMLTLELSARVYFAFQVGPSVLLYGTRFHRQQIELRPRLPVPGSEARPEAKIYRAEMTKEEWRRERTVKEHGNRLEGYSKYYPGQKRIDFDIETGESFDVSINRTGFRGRGFSVRKPDGVVRIVTLGSSSTFGYFNRDHETYPAQLERILNAGRSNGARFEVVNLAIPHLSTEEIYALFLAEGVGLDPDVVTFYEGNNDVARALRKQWRAARRSSSWSVAAGDRSLAIALINSLVEAETKIRSSPVDLEAQASAASKGFIGTLSKIHKACQDRGIVFVVANQQKNSQAIARADLKGVTYEEEVAETRDRLLQDKDMSLTELQLLMHARLMEDLAAWAKTKQLPLVDVIARLDQDRDVMVSWVHLSPVGNRMVAEAFAEVILRHARSPEQMGAGSIER